MAPQKVIIVGATGETGGSILNGLLEAGIFTISALVRPSSADKPKVKALKERNIELRVGDISTDTIDSLASLLADIDTVISAVPAHGQLMQTRLADAAKQAGVKRFIPCAFTTVTPPGGIMMLRDEKETVYQHIWKLYLPFTIIDVGYWHQLSFPRLPSGRVDYALFSTHPATFEGDPDMETAIVDERDIGKYVALIIEDERTLNQKVFAYGDLISQRGAAELLSRLSGEKIEPVEVSNEEVEAKVAAARPIWEKNPSDGMARLGMYITQYPYSKFVRGDNRPKYAKYLGYLDGRELYPDFKPNSFENYLKELLDGKSVKPYADGTP